MSPNLALIFFFLYDFEATLSRETPNILLWGRSQTLGCGSKAVEKPFVLWANSLHRASWHSAPRRHVSFSPALALQTLTTQHVGETLSRAKQQADLQGCCGIQIQRGWV